MKAKNWKKVTPTQRFNRFYEKLMDKHGKIKNWEVIDIMAEQRDSLKYLYESGYKQGLRDAQRKQRARSHMTALHLNKAMDHLQSVRTRLEEEV